MEITTEDTLRLNFEKADLDDMIRAIQSDDFVQFLMKHTTSFTAAAMIMDTLIKKADELREILNKEEN